VVPDRLAELVHEAGVPVVLALHAFHVLLLQLGFLLLA
jgi:hypothetical protein